MTEPWPVRLKATHIEVGCVTLSRRRCAGCPRMAQHSTSQHSTACAQLQAGLRPVDHAHLATLCRQLAISRGDGGHELATLSNESHLLQQRVELRQRQPAGKNTSALDIPAWGRRARVCGGEGGGEEQEKGEARSSTTPANKVAQQPLGRTCVSKACKAAASCLHMCAALMSVREINTTKQGTLMLPLQRTE